MDYTEQKNGGHCATESCAHQNVGHTERLFSALLGGATLMGLSSLRSISGLIATVAGFGLICRGVTGHCAVYESLGIDTCDESGAERGETRPAATSRTESVRIGDDTRRGSAVDEASDESFPASDPPAWTRTSAT